jgi:hypothetical protein
LDTLLCSFTSMSFLANNLYKNRRKMGQLGDRVLTAT